MAYRTSIINLRGRRGGFSVAEGLIASTILAIAVVGIAGPLGAAGQQGTLVRERSTALILARELMEEIAAKPLCDSGGTCHLGPESGETSRANYDSADDYQGYHDTTHELRDLGGRSLAFNPDINQSFVRDVTVDYRTSVTGSNTTSGDFAVVTVQVTTPSKLTVKLTRLLCKQMLTF
jgi:hypothetical protein